jgi:hypothetical protein
MGDYDSYKRFFLLWIIFLLLFVIAFVGVGWMVMTESCQAGQCWNYVCWSDSQCGPDCFCLLPGDGSQGECYLN